MTVLIDDSSTEYLLSCGTCETCANYKGFHNGFPTCAAFAKIPLDIWHGDFDHAKPHAGDHGIQFRQKAKNNG